MGLSRATPGLRLPWDAAGWCCELQASKQEQFRAICISPPPQDRFVLLAFQGSLHIAATASSNCAVRRSMCFKKAKKKVEYIICSQSQCKY